jgi:hypothetical protein
MLNLNGMHRKADELLAEAHAAAAEEEERRADEAAWLAWAESLLDGAGRLVRACPKDLRGAVQKRLDAALERLLVSGDDDGPEDQLLRWVEFAGRRDNAPIPKSLPAGLVRVYLEDESAVVSHECGECGLLVPTDNGGHSLGFTRCPACGGPTGPVAFFRAVCDAAKCLGWEAQRRMLYDGAHALDLLREAGYRDGERLSDWLKRRGAANAS